MLELIAQGPDLSSRWRRSLLVSDEIEIGRATPSFTVPWDSQISRRHARIKIHDGFVEVRANQDAANPIFFDGEAVESFRLDPGQHFVIGNTTFSLSDHRAFASLDAPDPISQKTFSPDFLRKVAYRDADRRIEILNRLPETISSASNRDELLIRIVNMLLAGIPDSMTVGIVKIPVRQSHQPGDIEVIKWDRRGTGGGDFQPSGKLIQQSFETEASVLHIWNQQKRASSEFTFDYENDWAFVSPISSVASEGWGIYVAGKNRGGSSSVTDTVGALDLQDDIKFCELIGSTLKNLMLVKEFERQNSSLRSFLSPVVIEAMSGRDPEEILAPKVCDVTVMFCDLRGFSKTSEQLADQLFELLNRVSNTLSIATGEILEHRGVVGDFHGDSVMGFWGWPMSMENRAEAMLQAVCAAQAIQKKISENKTIHVENDFQMGIGIASGTAVAGKIGSRDQVKVTAFGPVVNLASRLEGLTRWLNMGILIDLTTAKALEKFADKRTPLRRIGRFLPYGLKSEVGVFQVASSLEADSIVQYEEALQDFESGNWEQANQRLSRLSADDRAAQFLRKFIDERGGKPDSAWNGVVRLHTK